MKVNIDELQELARKAILTYGYTEDEADTIVEILMYAQLRGNNQGIVKLIGKGIPKDPNVKDIEVVKETKLSVLLDGGMNPGMVVMTDLMNRSVAKAREHGFGIAGSRNTKSSTGAIGFYAKKIAEQNLLGFVFAGSPPTICPYGSYEPRFGTNPIAIGMPTEEDPVVLDMATAAMAWYGLVEAKTAGKSIPDDVAYDSEGKPTTDPARAMEGSIRPFDRSYKGYGLAMMVETLCGPLTGAAYVGINDEDGGWGNLIYVIDPELLVDREAFKKQVSEMVENIKMAKCLEGFEEVLVPGERGNKLTKERMDSGEIEVEDNLYNELKKVAEEK